MIVIQKQKRQENKRKKKTRLISIIEHPHEKRAAESTPNRKECTTYEEFRIYKGMARKRKVQKQETREKEENEN